MKKELNNMEELFKTELENLNVVPDEHLEDLIASQIDFENPGKSRKFNRLFIYLLIIGLICVAGCATLIFSRNQTNEMGSETPVLITTQKHIGKSSLFNLVHKNSNKSQKNINSSRNHATSNGTALNIQPSITISNVVQNSHMPQINTQQVLSLNAPISSFEPQQNASFSTPEFSPKNTNETDKTKTIKEAPHKPIAFSNEVIEPLVKIEPKNDSNRYKHSFGIGTEFAISTQKIVAMNSADTTWSITRNPLSSLNLEYTHSFFRNFTVQTGFHYQKWSENWERSHDTSLFVTKDTIIFGVPATITFLDTIKRVNKDTYTTLNFGIPLMIGYQFNITNDFALNVGFGGLLAGTRVKRESTYYNSSLIALERKQTAISFSPKYSLGANYTFNHFGIGLRLNYSKPQPGKIDLFERGINRRNIGLGIQLFYRL